MTAMSIAAGLLALACAGGLPAAKGVPGGIGGRGGAAEIWDPPPRLIFTNSPSIGVHMTELPEELANLLDEAIGDAETVAAVIRDRSGSVAQAHQRAMQSQANLRAALCSLVAAANHEGIVMTDEFGVANKPAGMSDDDIGQHRDYAHLLIAKAELYEFRREAMKQHSHGELVDALDKVIVALEVEELLRTAIEEGDPEEERHA